MLNKQAKGCESQASLPKNSLCACSVDSSHASVLTSRTTDSVAYFTKTSWTISNGNSKMFRECKNTARVTNCGQCLDLCHERRSLIFFKQENESRNENSTAWALPVVSFLFIEGCHSIRTPCLVLRQLRFWEVGCLVCHSILWWSPLNYLPFQRGP